MKRHKILSNSNKEESLFSLNENLFSEFLVTKLEERLETDPFFISSMLDVDVETQGFCIPEWIDCICDNACFLNFSSCTEKG